MPLPLKLMLALALVALLGLMSAKAPHKPAQKLQGALKAKYLITTTDDFIVDIYQNGKHEIGRAHV